MNLSQIPWALLDPKCLWGTPLISTTLGHFALRQRVLQSSGPSLTRQMTPQGWRLSPLISTTLGHFALRQRVLDRMAASLTYQATPLGWRLSPLISTTLGHFALRQRVLDRMAASLTCQVAPRGRKTASTSLHNLEGPSARVTQRPEGTMMSRPHLDPGYAKRMELSLIRLAAPAGLGRKVPTLPSTTGQSAPAT